MASEKETYRFGPHERAVFTADSVEFQYETALDVGVVWQTHFELPYEHFWAVSAYARDHVPDMHGGEQ